MERFDCIVVGGGIVGLSVAWAIIQKNGAARIAVLEKENDWARHQTGRNSGVIHSGIYYKPGSLKARLCREGNRRLVEFCEQHGIRREVCGKVIVATTPAELPLLDNLYERGVLNGLKVRKLSTREVNEIEPHVRCVAGIHVPSTGIVDFTGVCRKLAELIQTRGGNCDWAPRFTGSERMAANRFWKRRPALLRLAGLSTVPGCTVTGWHG